MTKILALIGSYRTKGNTARIVQMIEARMQVLATEYATPLEYETLFLGDLDIHACRGCRACFDRGQDACPLKDDIPLIRAKMDAADGLLLASPVYVDDVSGLLKNWMDRLAYLCHRPAMGGKCAYPLATVGGSSTSHALRTMNAALLTWGYHLVGRTGLKMGALASAEELLRCQPAADKTADRLFHAIAQQQALNPAFISLMAFKIQQLAWQREPPGSYDHTWWQGQGWLEPACTFYFPSHSSRIKVALARLTGAIVYRFVV
ncbi:MAG: flavodoxin family protein [Anaerolineae bacterium]|nr:flavodoxin family protein [Anaerolineae bacterium]